MQRTLSGALRAHAGRRALIAGWLHHQRRLSGRTFLLVRDRDGIAQAVVEDPALIGELAALAPETVVAVEGTVVESRQAPGGAELHDPRVEVISAAEAPPIDLRRPVLREGLPTLLDHAAVALRHPTRRAARAVGAAAVAGFRRALAAHGFTEIHTPKLVAAAPEGGANVFAVAYFGTPAYLAQSPQLYKQIMVGALERVFEVAPAFRAEPHDTARHLAEYVSLDAEMGFVVDHHDVMAIARDAVAGMVEAVAAEAASAAALLGAELPDVPERIPAVHIADAQRMIEAGDGGPAVGEPDLAPAHERWLGDWAVREHGSQWLFVIGYPMAKRPFYTHPDPARPGFSNSFDLLFRGLEVITGGQRLHRHDDYVAALRERGQAAEPFAGYLEAFRHGMPPHGGFAIGLERFVARLVGAHNVREVTPFPRDLGRLAP